MRAGRWLVIGALALGACPKPGDPTGPSTPPPTDGAIDAVRAPPVPPDSLRLPAGVAPTGYQLSLTIDPEAPPFTGEVEIALAITAPTDVIWLHAAALTIDDATVTIGDATTPVAIVDDAGHQRIGLDLGRTVGPGPARAHLRYRGTIVDDDPMGLFRQREGGRWYAYTQMEGLFARRVVPCFDEPAFKVPWQVTVAAPDGDVVLANMPEHARAPREGGGVIVALEPSPPMSSYLLAVAVGPFEIVDVGPVGRDAVPARIITVAGQGNLAADAARVTPAIVTALEAYFDRALPLAKLDVAAVPVFFGAMENVGLITSSSSILLHDPARPSRTALRDLRATLAHEIAHQWFGDLVTPRWWDDLWLNESFATWMAAKILRELDPHDDAVDAARRLRGRAMAADALPSALPLRRPIAGDDDVDDSFDAIAYEKGAALLAMFERRLGADRFRAGVRAYVAAHAGGTASATDFVDALAAASEADTAAAFASFLDHAGTPEVGLALDCSGAAPAAVAELRSARGAAPWTLPLCVRFPDKAGRWGERCGWIPPAGGRIELPVCPTWLVGNADGAGYYRVAYAPPLADALRGHLRQIAVAERVALAADLVALARTGTVDAATFPAWIDAFLAAGDRHDVVAAVDLASFLGRAVDGDLIVPWRRWIVGRFGGVARRAGLRARSGETMAALNARRSLGWLVGGGAREPGLVRDARKQVAAWLGGGPDPGDERWMLLTIATTGGDHALYDQILAAAQAAGDREIRGALISALAGFVDAASIARNRELFVQRVFDPREAESLVVAGLGTLEGDAAAWAELTAHYDEIAAVLTPFDRPDLVDAAAARCSATAHAEVAAFFATRVADPRGARSLKLALEAIDLCVADRARQRDRVKAALSH